MVRPERGGDVPQSTGGRIAMVRGPVTAATLTLWRREMVRFFRQRSRVLGALATPVVFWLLLGSGLNWLKFQPPPTDSIGPLPGQVAPPGLAGAPAEADLTYLAYLYPGALLMILLFTAIFSTITLIEDRREGFLQSVRVAPIADLALVGGKILGGASIATIQGVVFLLFWPLVGDAPGPGGMAAAVCVMFITAAGLTALGVGIAWSMDSTAGFHAVMNLVLLPMWFLSGAMFPVATAPLWLRVIMYANPLTYGRAVLAATLHGSGSEVPDQVPLVLAAPLMLVFCGLGLVWAAAVVARPRPDGT